MYYEGVLAEGGEEGLVGRGVVGREVIGRGVVVEGGGVAVLGKLFLYACIQVW